MPIYENFYDQFKAKIDIAKNMISSKTKNKNINNRKINLFY